VVLLCFRCHNISSDIDCRYLLYLNKRLFGHFRIKKKLVLVRNRSETEYLQRNLVLVEEPRFLIEKCVTLQSSIEHKYALCASHAV